MSFFHSAAKSATKIRNYLKINDIADVCTELTALVAKDGMDPQAPETLKSLLADIDKESAAKPPLTESEKFGRRLERWWLSSFAYVPLTDSQLATEAIGKGLGQLAANHLRDKKFIPVFDSDIDLIADRQLETGIDTARTVKRLASPKWLGDVGIEENMALTGLYKRKQPLKRAAMKAFLRIADKAISLRRFSIATDAANGAYARNANDLEDLNREVSAKLEQIENTRPKQFLLPFGKEAGPQFA